jgi:hypothetical protein
MDNTYSTFTYLVEKYRYACNYTNQSVKGTVSGDVLMSLAGPINLKIGQDQGPRKFFEFLSGCNFILNKNISSGFCVLYVTILCWWLIFVNNYQSLMSPMFTRIGWLLASHLEKVAFYWSFIPENGLEIANLLANEKQARLADEISPTLLTNKKRGNIDYIHAVKIMKQTILRINLKRIYNTSFKTRARN